MFYQVEREKRKGEQQELINELKKQLDDLETFAYASGEGGPPQSVVLQKQKLVLGK